MSCDRRCFNLDSGWYGHDECSTCPGRDDGTSPTVKEAEELNALRKHDAATIRAALMRNPATTERANALAALDKIEAALLAVPAQRVGVLGLPVVEPKGLV